MAKGEADPGGGGYAPEWKLRIVKAAVEKKLGADDIKKTYGVGVSTWCRCQEGGDQAVLKGLQTIQRPCCGRLSRSFIELQGFAGPPSSG